MGVETESESQVPVVKEESEEIKGPDVQRSETEVSDVYKRQEINL